ncbi:hypothetical protein SELMODRAFT_446417 [Selaginella moellendorffii]|uniref:Uncharacterized protein n=1 Tax=Selaginella moellendorffii TaxID=88036 RepID=D8SR79_SELML|nr:hypothetical protein SELMODRAFT_446417 [Selaginella moellendorffii]
MGVALAAFLPQISATGGSPSRFHQQQHRRPRRASRLVPFREDDDDSSASSSARPEDHPYFFSDEIERADGALRFFATCAPGLEDVVAAELRASSIGAHSVKTGSSGVYFSGSWHTGFLANLWSRCAVRVLQLIAAADLRSSRYGQRSDPVYNFVKDAVDWKTLVVAGNRGKLRSFSIHSRVWDCSEVSNTMVACTRAKDAICDALRDCCGGKRPDPPDAYDAADLPLFLSLYRDKALLYRDMSGTSLHMRGYRDAMHKASLNEAIAAGILTMAGWNDKFVPGFGTFNKNVGGGRVLMDPMCGSGTFLIEAALMALNIAPGLLRPRWPFMKWHDYDKMEWKLCCKEATEAQVKAPRDLQLLGNDLHEGSLLLCTRDAKRAGVEHLLRLSCEDCRRYVPPVCPSLVTVNPPWGNRLNEEEPSLIATYMALGRFLKQYSSRADVYVLSGNSTLTRQLQMKADRKWPITVGGFDCRLLHYYILPPKTSSVAARGSGGKVSAIAISFDLQQASLTSPFWTSAGVEAGDLGVEAVGVFASLTFSRSSASSPASDSTKSRARAASRVASLMPPPALPPPLLLFAASSAAASFGWL